MLVVVVAVAFATAVVSAYGQSTTRVRSQIPFEFIVGSKTMPAGEYFLKSASSSGAALMISTADGKVSAIRLTNTIGPKLQVSEAKLVFHRYGEKYFLAEVWTGADNTGRVLLPSKQEKSIKREYSGLAQNTYEVVEVVALAL